VQCVIGKTSLALVSSMLRIHETACGLFGDDKDNRLIVDY